MHPVPRYRVDRVYLAVGTYRCGSGYPAVGTPGPRARGMTRGTGREPMGWHPSSEDPQYRWRGKPRTVGARLEALGSGTRHLDLVPRWETYTWVLATGP